MTAAIAVLGTLCSVAAASAAIAVIRTVHNGVRDALAVCLALHALAYAQRVGVAVVGGDRDLAAVVGLAIILASYVLLFAALARRRM